MNRGEDPEREGTIGVERQSESTPNEGTEKRARPGNGAVHDGCSVRHPTWGGVRGWGDRRDTRLRPGVYSAGTTGLTAAMIAMPHERIGGVINASGCDVGIYVGPTARNVTIVWATVSNANDHGIFVQDARGTVIANDVVAHNGIAPHKCSTTVLPPCIQEDKAIELSGTHDATVRNNLVADNVADGGIGVSDDGPVDPGAPAPGALHAGSSNEVRDNTILDNAFGCGIVVAAYNPVRGRREE